jgi:diguanylate cyclase (GGDEF)-like protein/putative nucleotidyltransferase with HDIG domain
MDRRLPVPARVYLSTITTLGLICLLLSIGQWRTEQMGQFLFYLACAVACSGLKVSLPGLTGTLSVNFLFILVSVIELTLSQTVLIAAGSGIAQLFFSSRRLPRQEQVVFTAAGMAVCATATWGFFHWPPLTAGLPLKLFFTTILYFVANTVSVAGIVSLTEGKKLWQLWHKNFFWTAPHYLAGAAVVALVHVWNVYIGWESGVLVLPVAYLLYHSYRLYLGRLEEERKHVGEMADLHLRTIQALALSIDARDGTTSKHLQRVQVYARELAIEFGLPEEERRALAAAALLHDIGKLGVPEHIISKPGRLTPEEFEKMKIHPVVGAEILESVQFPYPVVPIVRHHHEKWDGTGYPDGLRGADIPLSARILSAVDCLDALSSDRQYRRALPLDEAMQKVVSMSGTNFDPAVVEVLERRYHELEKKAHSEPKENTRVSKTATFKSGKPEAGFEETARVSKPVPAADFLSLIAAARQEFTTLLELTRDLGNSLRMDDTMSLLAARLKDAVPYDAIAIYTVDGERLVTQYASGEDARLFESLSIPLGEGLSGWVAGNNRAIVNGNPSVEPGYLNDVEKFSVLRSALSVPLAGSSGVIGALTLYRRQANAFTRDHLRILQVVSSKAGLTIENALRFVQVEHTATTDSLTGLANARSLYIHLNTEVARAQRSETQLAVLVIDMNGFKAVNDNWGHAVGDKVLQATGQILNGACREYDYAARVGGDEFVLLVPEIDALGIQSLVERLNAQLAESGREICPQAPLSLSVGAAYFPEDGMEAEQLLAAADAKMYAAKRRHYALRDARNAPVVI